MRKRNVKRHLKRTPRTPMERLQAFVLSFHPHNFRDYWLNKDGAKRAAKIVGGMFGLLLLVILWFAKDLPSPNKINARLGAQTTKFYDRKGETVLYEVFGDKNRTIVEFDKISDKAKQATIAIEDHNFYEHGAFSSIGILRAAIVNVISGGRVQGGSTITQQYVKNALLTSERTFTRKIRELILAIIIEQFYKKDDILKLYLNEIPYGNNAYGIEAACRTYFPSYGDRECAAQLKTDEAAMLAAIPRAPTYYSPYGQHRDALIARRNLVINKMAEEGYINREEADAAIKTDTLAKLPAKPNYFANIIAPHFVLYLQEQLEAKYGAKAVTEGGLKIVTSLDVDKQKLAEEVIAKNMANVRKAGGSNSALVASDPKTGEILAMVGSYDFGDKDFGAYNVAISDRQPGSSFKPIVYATAWGADNNYGPGTTLYDVDTDFGGGYKPKNYSRTNYGVQSMRTALAGSLNIPAVKTLYLAGIDKAIDQAHKMGITTLNGKPGDYGLALTLGAGEVKLVDMVNAYQAFANGGVHHKSTGILKVTDAKGKVLQEFKPDKDPERVLDPQVAYLMSHVLSDNGARAYIFGNLLTIPGRQVAVKTGTTESYRDAWTIGYTPSLAVGVWSGNNDNQSMNSGGVSVSAPAWRDFMIKALAGTPNEPFVAPKGIKQIELDAHTGRLPTEGTKERRTDIFPSWYKPTDATGSRSAVVDKVSGKLATDCTPPLARETRYSSEIHAEIPPTDIAFARWEPPVQALAIKLGYPPGGTLPSESDTLHSCSDTKPKVTLDVDNIAGGNYKLTAKVTSGTHTADKLEIKLDNQIISTQAINGSTTYEFVHSVETNGSHTFSALVTDSALYQAEDKQTVNVSGAGTSSFKGTTPLSGASFGAGSTVSFGWTTHPEADKYKLVMKRGGTTIPTATASNHTAENVTLAVPGSYTWYVEAISGASTKATTSVYSFTVN